MSQTRRSLRPNAASVMFTPAARRDVAPPRRKAALKANPATSTGALARELCRVAEVVEDNALRLALRTLASDVDGGALVAHHLEHLTRAFRGERAVRNLIWLARDAAALERRD